MLACCTSMAQQCASEPAPFREIAVNPQLEDTPLCVDALDAYVADSLVMSKRRDPFAGLRALTSPLPSDKIGSKVYLDMKRSGLTLQLRF